MAEGEVVTEHLKICPWCRVEVEALETALNQAFGPRKSRQSSSEAVDTDPED